MMHVGGGGVGVDTGVHCCGGTSEEDQWGGHIMHKLKETIDAGRELLAVLAIKRVYLTPGSPRGRYTSIHGSTPNSRGGTASMHL